MRARPSRDARRRAPRGAPGRRLPRRRRARPARTRPRGRGPRRRSSRAASNGSGRSSVLGLLAGRRRPHRPARPAVDPVVPADSVPARFAAAVAASSSPTIARRIASSPRRMRLLTVPSGVPVRSEISCWVKPAKYPSSIAWRWTSESAPSAARTASASRFAETSPHTSGSWNAGGGTASRSGSSVVGRRRRTASIARWWTIDSSHVFTLPRPSMYLAALRQTPRNASWTTSSARVASFVIRYAME